MTLSDRPIHLLDPFESRLDEGEESIPLLGPVNSI